MKSNEKQPFGLNPVFEYQSLALSSRITKG